VSKLVSLIQQRTPQSAVVAGEVVISVAGVDLIYLGLNVVLASVETGRKLIGDGATNAARWARNEGATLQDWLYRRKHPWRPCPQGQARLSRATSWTPFLQWLVRSWFISPFWVEWLSVEGEPSTPRGRFSRRRDHIDPAQRNLDPPPRHLGLGRSKIGIS